jgi:DNA-binding NtrC family response regulator
MKNILIVDDEYEMIQSLKKILSLRNDFKISTEQDGNKAMSLVSKKQFDLIVCDLKIGSVSGISIVKQTLSFYPETPIIMISGYATIEAGVEAVKAGVADFIEKPFTSLKLFESIDRALASELKAEQVEFKTLEIEQVKLIYKSEIMEQLIEVVKKVARNDMNVLITGESGTGKEVIARIIHSLSNRKVEPFVPVNCGALPENLFESEIFGHERGAFTGAVKNKSGLIEFADHGTFFLDEVGEIGNALQVKLLRMLEERKIRRVGGQKEFDVDVRIIAATNKDLELEVDAKTFRQDLFYRLNTIRIHIPPLRERVDDIIPLAQYYMCELCNNGDSMKRKFSEDAERALREYSWPGNVRELQNVLGRAYYLCSTNTIEASDLPIHQTQNKISLDENLMALSYKDAKDNLLEKFEQDYLTYNLKKYKGNISQTALQCGIDRRSIHRLISKHNIIYKE